MFYFWLAIFVKAFYSVYIDLVHFTLTVAYFIANFYRNKMNNNNNKIIANGLFQKKNNEQGSEARLRILNFQGYPEETANEISRD